MHLIVKIFNIKDLLAVSVVVCPQLALNALFSAVNEVNAIERNNKATEKCNQNASRLSQNRPTI